MMHDFATRPLVGRLIALDVRPTRTLTLLGPAWAAICGAIASGGLTLRGQTLLTLILIVMLCDAFLGAWRSLWLSSDWRPALGHTIASSARWLHAPGEASQFILIRWSNRISRWVQYLREIIWPIIESEMIGMLIAGILALSAAVVLGTPTFLLTGFAMLLSLIEGQIGTARGAGLRAICEIALPFHIAQSAFGFFSWSSLVFSVLFTLVYRALLGLATTRQMNWIRWSNIAQLAVVWLLLMRSSPIGGGLVAMGLLAQVLWQARLLYDRDGNGYARRIQSYILVSMLIVALSLWIL